MSQNLRSQADWLATEGNLAAAPNLYWWASMLRWLRTIMPKLGAWQGRTFDDIEAVRAWLAQRGLHRRIGVVGLDPSELRHQVMRLVDDRQMVNGLGGRAAPRALRRYDLKLWIGSGDVSAAYLPG